uniref:ANK_REP_REGION domain-containing protein n=1 Tax=Caenorhabditis tropicalis TaxID=1561998 RepID=A0A1I7T4N3_9PELO
MGGKETDYMHILKEQFNALQSEHQSLRRKYELLSASSTSESPDSLPSRLLSVTSSLLESPRFSDIKFRIPKSSDTIPAHKLVLEARTDFWKLDDEEILISDDVDLEAFHVAIRWIYTDEIDWKISDGKLLKVCETAAMFRLEQLKNVCVTQLGSRLHVDNCIQIYEFAEKQGLRHLSQTCGAMIAGSWNLLGPAHFSQMTAPLLYRLIDGNTQNVLHSIVSIGREDVLFLYFMQNSGRIPECLNLVDEDGSTGLERALCSNNPKAPQIAQQLIEKGADVNVKDSGRGETILMRMCRKENLSAMDFLLKNGADGRLCQSPDDYNIVHVASRIDSPSLSKWIGENKERLDLDKVDGEERTPLMCSVIQNNHLMVETLIRSGVRLDVATSEGHTALSTCLLMSTSPNRRIAELLILNGADVNIRIYSSRVPLINEIISRKDTVSVESLLSAGVDCHVEDQKGMTACHVAAEEEATEILSKIVEARRRLRWTRDHEDRTALDISIGKRDLKTARICIKGGADVNARDESGQSLLAKAILENDDEIGVFLIENDAKAREQDRISGKTYLESACERGLLNTVRSFISNGCKLNSRCSTGYTLIHAALSHQKMDVAALLINFGCDLESRVWLSSSGEILEEGDEEWSSKQTLLHRLIDDADQPGAVFLIDNGADVNARKEYSNPADDDLFSPAHMAISWAQNDVLRALKDRGANLCDVDSDGRTAAHIGVREQNMEGVKILLEAENVDFIPMRDKFGQTILSQSMALKDHQMASLIVARQPHAAVQTNGNGENLLHQAIRQNDLESVLFLLAVAKADPCRPINDGTQKTPLHLAAASKDEMILRNLILVNENVNVTLSDGTTPLLEALRHRNEKHVGILLENGAEPNLKDEHGENAMLCAVRSGSLDCIRVVAENPKTNRYTRNKIGYTSLHICALLTIDKLPKRTSSSDVIELILSYEEGETGRRLNEKQMAAFVDARDSDGNTALMIAYSQGNAGVCRSLLKRRACLGQRNNADVNVFTYETATKQLLLGLLESLESEPRWSDGDTCDCGSKFSLTSRKHHCRHCGRHVCSKCSETTMPIAKYGEEKRVRVCDVCAHVISTGTAPPRR